MTVVLEEKEWKWMTGTLRQQNHNINLWSLLVIAALTHPYLASRASVENAERYTASAFK